MFPCKVNLIEYNPIDDGEFQQASEEATNAYIKALEANSIVVKVRRVVVKISMALQVS
jgi:23S rRNA (adenine2503-C2)-methyltransferase